MNNFIKKYKKLSIPVKASMWFLICNFIQKAISFITTPIFTRILSNEQYGQFNIYISWSGILILFTSLGLYGGVFNNGMIKYENKKDEFSSAIQGLSTCITIGIIIVYVLFKKQINLISGFDTSVMLLMFIDVFFTASINYWTIKQRFIYKYRNVVCVTLSLAIINPIFGLIAVNLMSEHGIARIVSYVICDAIIGGILYIAIAYKGKLFFDKVIWKYALKFNIPLVPHMLSLSVLGQSDRIMINNMVNGASAGIYSLAQNTATIISAFTNSINASLTPWIYGKLKDKQYSEIGEKINYILIFIGLMVLGIVICAPEIIAILASKEYSQAIWIIPSVSTSVYFIFLYGIFVSVEFYYEETRFIMYASLSGAVLNIILNYVTINLFGYIAAGYTTLFCYICFCFAHYLCMRRVCNKFINGYSIFNIKIILLISLNVLIGSILITFLYNQLVLRYILVIIGILVLVKKRKYLIDIFQLKRRK